MTQHLKTLSHGASINNTVDHSIFNLNRRIVLYSRHNACAPLNVATFAHTMNQRDSDMWHMSGGTAAESMCVREESTNNEGTNCARDNHIRRN